MTAAVILLKASEKCSETKLSAHRGRETCCWTISNVYQQTTRIYSEVSGYLPRKDEKKGEEGQEVD